MKFNKNSLFAAFAAMALVFTGCPSPESTSDVAVKSVSVSETEISLAEGEKTSVTVAVSPSNATNKAFTVSSSDKEEAFVKVTADGTTLTIEGLAKTEEEVTVTVTTADGAKTAQVKVSVTGAAVPVTGIELSSSSVEVGVGLSVPVTVSVLPDDATEKSVSVTSSDTDNSYVKADYDEATGVLTLAGLAVTTENVTLTVTSSSNPSVKAELSVAVKALPGLKLSSTSEKVSKGNSVEVTVSQVNIEEYDASNLSVVSSDSEVASAELNGEKVVIKALKSGTATIKVSYDSYSASMVVTVPVAVESFTTEVSSLDLTAGDDSVFTVTANPSNAEDKSFTVESSDEEVATAEANGTIVLVTALKAGNAEITVSNGEVSAKVSVTVHPAVSSITPSVTELTDLVAEGDEGTFTVEVGPEGVLDSSFTAESSNEKVAKVSVSGKTVAVTPLAKGSAKITLASVQDKSITSEVAVTVAAAPVTVQALPVVATGNSATRIEGAGVMINLDNSKLGISGANAADILKTLNVTLSTGSIGDVKPQFDDYGTSTVRLYFTLAAAVSDLTVHVDVTIGDVPYSGDITFTNGKWIPSDYEVTGITVTPSGKSLRAGNTLQFAAADSTYGITQNVTWSCDTGTIDENGLYTAPDSISEDTTATITATYSETVKGTVTVALVADSTEVEPFTVALSNEGGAWMKIDVYYNDAAYAINADNAKISDVKLSVDGSALSNVSWVASLTNGVRWARDFPSANLTNSGVTQDLTFTVEIATGEKYSFKVNFTGANNTEMTVNSTEYSLLKDIALSSTSETLENVNDTVDITVSGVGLTLDNSKISASSSAEGVATVAVSGNTLTVTAVAEGDAVITVSYADEDVADKTVKIHVGEKQLLESYDFTNTTYYAGDNITTREASKVVLTSHSSDANNYTTQFKYMGLTLEPGSYVATVTLKSSVARKLDFFVQQNSTWTMITQSSPFDVEADTEITKTVDLTISNTTDNLMLCVMAGNVGTAVDSEVTITYLNIEEK